METFSNFLIITLIDPDAGSIPVAVCESIGWFLGKLPFPAIFFLFYANMPELVQGGRLKICCVRTRGFEPHCWQG